MYLVCSIIFWIMHCSLLPSNRKISLNDPPAIAELMFPYVASLYSQPTLITLISLIIIYIFHYSLDGKHT